MGQFYPAIPETYFAWLRKQEMFWVATAPLAAGGHVNLSPKGARASFRIISGTKVWYEDLTGSGVETIAHLRENGRITLLFCAFEGAPRIVRLFGTGVVHEFGTPEYDALLPAETRKPGSRAAIVIDVHRVGSSCGYAVPLYDFQAHRTRLLLAAQTWEDNDIAAYDAYAASVSPSNADTTADTDTSTDAWKSDRGLQAYWAKTNLRSVDGLPGLVHAPRARGPARSAYDLEESRKAGGARGEGEGSGRAGRGAGALGAGEARLVAAFALGAIVAVAVGRVAERWARG